MDQENEDETDGKMILVKHFAFLASKKTHGQYKLLKYM